MENATPPIVMYRIVPEKRDLKHELMLLAIGAVAGAAYANIKHAKKSFRARQNVRVRYADNI